MTLSLVGKSVARARTRGQPLQCSDGFSVPARNRNERVTTLDPEERQRAGSIRATAHC